MSARAWLVADPDSICNPDPVLYVILNVKILTFYVSFTTYDTSYQLKKALPSSNAFSFTIFYFNLYAAVIY